MRDEPTDMGEQDGQPGVVRFIEAKPNPTGGIQRLFLVQGQAVSQPIDRIENADVLPKTTGTGRLQLFHFNDLHNHLTELSGQDKGTHRFSQMVKRVRDARSSSTTDGAVLFLSIGDDHTGSVFDELLGWRADQFVLDASYHAYSGGGVDATVLGNHEFDRGGELLALGIRQDATFPVLSANAHSSAHLVAGQDYFSAAIAIAGNLRIAMIGLTTHIETRVGQPNDPTFAVASPIRSLENLLPALDPFADVILIMSHCGFGDGEHKSGKSAASRNIGEADFSIAQTAARLTSKPVLVLGAHTHTKLNENGLNSENTLDGVSIFQAECNGKYLGEINLDIGPQEPSTQCIQTARLHAIKPNSGDIGPDHPNHGGYEQPSDFDQPFEKEFIAPLIERMKAISNKEIAQVTTKNLSFKSAVRDRYFQECTLLNFMCDAVFDRLNGAGFSVDFAMMNGATVQAGVEPGTLKLGAWYDVMPYADQVFLLEISGRELEHMLQSNAKRILRDSEVSSTDYTGFLPRGFVHTSRHIRYQIDPGSCARDAKASAILINAQPIASQYDRRFSVAVPTYLALGAFGEHWNGQPIVGGVPGRLAGYDLRSMPHKNTDLIFRDEIAAHIKEQAVLDHKTAPACDGRLTILAGQKGKRQ